MVKKSASCVLGLRAHRLGALRAVRARNPQRTYSVRFRLLAACGLAGEHFHHSLEGRTQAKMVLGTFAETQVPRRAGAKPCKNNALNLKTRVEG